MEKNIHFLILDDNDERALLYSYKLGNDGIDASYERASNAAELEAALDRGGFDMAVSDFSCAGIGSVGAIRLIKERNPFLPVIIISKRIDTDALIAALKSGAHNFIQTSELTRLAAVAQEAIAEAKSALSRKKTEEALKVGEERFHAFMNNIPVVGFIKDEAGRYTYCNRHWERIFLRPAGEVVGKTDYDLWPQDVAQRLRANDSLILSSNETSNETNERVETVPRPDGTESYWMVFKFPLREVSGKRSLGGVAVDITQRTLNEKRIASQVKKLSALRAIDTAITSSMNLPFVLGIFIDQVAENLDVDSACVMLYDDTDQAFRYSVCRGFRTEWYKKARLRLGEGHEGKAALERRTISVPDVSNAKDEIANYDLMSGEGFKGYYVTPLIAKGHIKGLLQVFKRSAIPADPEWVEFLETLAGQAAIAIDNATMFEDLERSNTELTIAYDATLQGWSRAIDLREKETGEHCQRVVDNTLRLARIMGVQDKDIIHVRRGALLHDIGKIGIPDNILLKPDKLTEDEFKIMRMHPQYAYDLLKPIEYLKPAIAIPYCHHEKWDGTGYPRGLKGESIPLAARIFSVIDVWDALRSDRPYRPAWPVQKVVDYIKSLRGAHFDPNVADAFLEMIRSDPPE